MARRRQSVTIKHVAADAGVSLQTVSRVINNEPNVRPAMKERVQAAIDRLGYVPSLAAQRMSGSRSYLILALNDRERTIAEWRSREGSDWVDQMLLGGMLKAAEHGCRMMIELVDTHSDHVERELSATLAALQPDGIILTPPHSDNPQIVELLADRGIPFVRIGSDDLDAGIAMTMGDERSAYNAAKHLIDAGHSRIGFIAGPDEYRLSTWRTTGWRTALEEHGLPTEGLSAKGDFGQASGEEAARVLLDRADPPTAIIASNDHMALGVLEVARGRGLAVPADLSLISFDNTPAVRYSQPPISSVDQPVAQTASRAVELLIGAQRGEPGEDSIVHVEGGFFARESVAPPKR